MNLKPEELVKALREDCKTCSENPICENGTNLAGLYCANKDAADQIEHDQKEIAELREENERLTAENAKAEAERDAALADLADARSCKTCKYACDTRDCSSCKSKTCKCRECHLDKNAWEWRGALDAPEEGDKHEESSFNQHSPGVGEEDPERE